MSENEKKPVNPVIDDEHEKRWYVVNTYSGHENRVKENL
jgi:transcriptional antiterminator NusG